MAIATQNPTANTTPDQGGTLAVTSPTNTGHSNSTCTASGGTNSVFKSCRWSSFVNVSNQISATLKVGFSRNGTLSDGGIDTYNQYLTEYTVNGGSSWSTIRNDEFITSSSSGEDSVALTVPIDLTQVQVRDFLAAQKAGATSATLTGSVSNIRVEVLTQDSQVIIIM